VRSQFAQTTLRPRPNLRQLACWGTIAIAYAIAFLQRTSPQTILDLLQHDFSTTAQGVGVLASAYFYGYMAMQIPAGIIVDSFGVRRVILASLTASAIGTALFSLASGLATAFAARLFIASSDALIFIALLKFVAQQFSDRHFGLMSGLSQVSGYLGGIVATVPLAFAVSHVGWRWCFVGLTAVILVDLLAAHLTIPRAADGAPGPREADRGKLVMSLWSAFKRVGASARTAPAWGCALAFSSHFVAVTSLSAVWGVPLLMHVYGLSRAEASGVMLISMVMTLIGSIGFGVVVDKVSSPFQLLVVFAAVRILLLAAIAPWTGPAFGIHFVIVCLAMFGVIGGGTMPLIFKSLRLIFTPSYIGIGTSLSSTLGGVITAAIQPVMGWVLEATWTGREAGGAKVYSATGYDWLVLILICISAIGILAPLLMRRAISTTVAASVTA
jgi:MFS family permease